MGEKAKWRFNTAAHSNFVVELPFPERQAFVEYVYIGEDGESIHSKCKKLNFIPDKPSDVPVWTYSSNFPIEDRFLQPVAIYKDPFRRGDHKLVLCEVYANDWSPAPRNFRKDLKGSLEMEASRDLKPWVGVEQEYTIIDENKQPLGYPSNWNTDSPIHHNSVGMYTAYGRDLYEAHLFACSYAGINIAGGNAEACSGQWEFQIGPNDGLQTCDDLWMARYILQRLSEVFGVGVSFHPKLMSGNLGSCGGHVNFSTALMQCAGGIEHIKAAMPRLEKTHQLFMTLCDPNAGGDNTARLESCCTPSPYVFTWGIEDKDATVRIPRKVALEGKGYFEDRRPASNFDPYLIVNALVQTVVLEQDTLRTPYLEPKVIKPAVPK